MNFDHLSLFDVSNKNHAAIIRVVDSVKEKRQPVLPFSDEMFIFNASKKKAVYIIITDNVFLILTKKYTLIKKFSLVELNSIVSITSNSSIMSIKFRESRRGTVAENIKSINDKTNGDIILETYRRSEFIVFLINSADLNDRVKPNLLTANQFRIDNALVIDFEINEDEYEPITNESVLGKMQPNKNRTMLMSMESRDYLMAYKAGYLFKCNQSLLRGGKWDKRFYVLCSIGLIYMNNPSQKDVKLFPFQDFKVVEISFSKLKKAYVLEVKTSKGGSNNIVL